MNSTAQPPSPGLSSSSPGVGAAPADPLTAKQRAVWDLVRSVAEGGQGKTQQEAAGILGISKPVVNKYVQTCRKKLGIKMSRNEIKTAEHKNPPLAAAVLDVATEPQGLQKIRDALREAGLPLATAEALLKRIRVKYYGLVTEVRNLKTQEILDLLGQKIHLALTYMDDKVFSEASFRDLALGTTAMIEKRQLLRGEPTAIISDAERAKLHELLPLAIAEARRRGLTIEGQVTEKTVEHA